MEMVKRVMVVVLASALATFAQGRPGGSHPGGPPSGSPGMGGSSMGRGDTMSGDRGSMGRQESDAHGMSQVQQPLKDSQINGGAFRMLEKKSGMTSSQLQDAYHASGAKNFGEFVSAIVVSKNLNLDTSKVLDGLKTASLGQTLQNLGVDKKKAGEEIKRAHQEMKAAEKT
jgi:hypothetical protein